MITDVTDLEVYKKSLKLLRILYTVTNKLPKDEFDLRRQANKAGKSIPALIAEGFAKRSSAKEFKRFLKMALGSSDEVITHLRVIAIILPTLSLELTAIANRYITLSKQINTLHKRWQSGGTF